MWNTLINATTVREASDAVLLKFERPADQSEKVCACRAGYGQKYYDKYKDGITTAPTTPTPPSTIPYLVRITDKFVRIRKGPGANYGSYGYIQPGVYTIVEEQNGWGLLKAYAKYRNGWIPLNCVKKV